MPNTKSPRRKYDSSRRQAQARLTRLQIAESARKLFFERGYAGATIDAIAAQARVAPETVYAIFKSKSKILAFLLDISIAGDDQRVRILDRPETLAALHDTDQRRQLITFGGYIAEIMSRAATVFEITRIAAKTEPEIERRLRHIYRARLENMTTFVHHVAANGPLRPGLDEAHAAEIVWGVSSPELFQLFTQYHGWSKKEYAAWLTETLERLLLG